MNISLQNNVIAGTVKIGDKVELVGSQWGKYINCEVSHIHETAHFVTIYFRGQFIAHDGEVTAFERSLLGKCRKNCQVFK